MSACENAGTDKVVGATRHRGAKKVAVLLAAAVLALGVAELGLRTRQYLLYRTWAVPGWLKSEPTDTGVWHPFLRTVPRPSLKRVEAQGNSRTVVEINSLGFRGAELLEAKPAGTFRVVCVGGSVVFDTRVDTDQSWPRRLQERLQGVSAGRPVEVVNAGIPGRTSADSVVNVALRVLPLSPDVVIVMHGVNDQKPNRYPGFRPDYSHWYQAPDQDSVARMGNRLIDHSLFACHVRQRLSFSLNPYLRENWRGEALTRYDTVAQPGLDAYRRNLESIIGMCRMQGCRVVIATVGHSLDGNADWSPSSGTRNPLVYYHENLTLEGIRDGFRQYNRVNREVAATNACPLVDVEELLPAGAENFQDDVHFTPEGSQMAAELFLERVPWRFWMEAPLSRISSEGL